MMSSDHVCIHLYLMLPENKCLAYIPSRKRGMQGLGHFRIILQAPQRTTRSQNVPKDQLLFLPAPFRPTRSTKPALPAGGDHGPAPAQAKPQEPEVPCFCSTSPDQSSRTPHVHTYVMLF